MTTDDASGVATDAPASTGTEGSAGSIPAGTTVASLALFLAFFLLSQMEAIWGSRLVIDLDAGGWDWGLQAISVLVPLAAIPLVLAPLRASCPSDRTTRALLSAGLLFVYAASLWVAQARGFAGYLLLMALAPFGVVLTDRAAGEGEALLPSAGPLLAGWGPSVWMAGLGAYAIAVANVIAIVPLALGLVALVVATPWAAASEGLHPSPLVRRALVAGLLAGLAVALFATAWVEWCFAAPLVYLVAPPALLGFSAGVWPPWTVGPSRAGWKGWQRLRWGAVGLAGVLLILLAARTAGLGLSPLCG